jgi:hypothetical protein
MTYDHGLARHDTSLGQANDGTDGGMHEASGWGVFLLRYHVLTVVLHYPLLV